MTLATTTLPTALRTLALCAALAFPATACESDGDPGTPTPDFDSLLPGADTDAGGGGGGGDTGGGGDGGPGPGPGGETVAGLQQEAEANPCDEAPPGFTNHRAGITLAGVVVTSPMLESSAQLDGFFVADAAGGPWSGVFVTVAKDAGVDVTVGDVVTLEGELLDFFCNTQFAADVVTVTGTGASVATTVVAPADFAQEDNEGRLVTVEDVTLAAGSAGGVYALPEGGEVSYGFDFFLDLEAGKTYTLTGVVRYAFGEYQLIPRFSSDVIDGGGSVGPGPGEETVAALQQEAEANPCAEAPPGFTNHRAGITLEGVVVTSPMLDSSAQLDGFFVADAAGGPWSGLFVTVAKGSGVDVAVGDTVTLEGELLDFFCNTQFAADTVTVTSTGAAVTPTVVDPADFAQESNEGRLVTVEDVTLAPGGATGVYALPGGGEVSYGFDFFLSLEAGETYTLTGVVRYAFGEYQLIPRFESDVVGGGGGGGPIDPVDSGVQAIQDSPGSVGCTEDGFVNLAQGLSFEAIVVVERWSASSNLHAYAVSDGSNAPFSGMQVVVPKSLETDFKVGDKVAITGQHVEFYCQTQLDADAMTLVEAEQAVPGPLSVDAEALGDDAEPYEGMLVAFGGVTVTDVSGFEDFGQVELSNGILLDNLFFSFEVPEVGDEVGAVAGLLTWSFDAYRVNPIVEADLTWGPVEGDPAPEPMPEMAEDAGSTDAMDGGATDGMGTEEVIDDVGPTDDTTGDDAGSMGDA